MATKIFTYTAAGTEVTTFHVPNLAGKSILAMWRAGRYKRVVNTAPADSEEIKVTGTDLGSNKGILSTTGYITLETGDGLLINEKLDFLYDDSIYGVSSADEVTAYKTYAKRPFTSSVIIANGLASNMPATVRYHRSQLYHFICYHSDVTGITNLVQTFKDESGNTLSTSTTDNSGYVAKKIRQVNIGEQALNIPAAAEYSLLSGAGVSLRVDYLCDGKFTPLTLAWLNPYGGYDSQSFGFMSKKSIEVERKQFARLNYNIESNGTINYQANNVFHGSRKTFSSVAKVKMRLTSHLLNEDEYTWLADLFVSPDVYLFDATSGYFIPVMISGTNYEYRNYKNSKLTSLELEVEFTDEYNAQHL